MIRGRPKPEIKSVQKPKIRYDPKTGNYRLGKTEFVFKREGEYLNLYRIMQGRIERKPYVTATLMQAKRNRMLPMQKSEPIAGKTIRLAGIRLQHRYRLGPYSIHHGEPKPEHKGRSIYAAYIDYCRRHGAKVIFAQVIAPRLVEHYRSLGFAEIKKPPRYLKYGAAMRLNLAKRSVRKPPRIRK